MCGLVGVAGNLLAVDREIFKELLLADVVRGKHATGVARVERGVVDIHKLAMPSPFFLDLKSTDTFLSSTMANVFLGHNRHATQGAAGASANAHPFTSGHITLAHNGTLTSFHSLTPYNERYDVDSMAICRAFELYGAEETIPKLQGAFALTWINTQDNTLNFVRNGERRLGLAFNTKANRMYWASEIELLLWSLKRGSDLFGRSPTTFDEHYELEAGVMVTIPLVGTTINLEGMTTKEVALHKPTTYRGTSTQTSTTTISSSYTKSTTDVVGEPITEYAFGNTREDALSKLAASILTEKGRSDIRTRNFISTIDTMMESNLLLDDRIPFYAEGWKPYSTTTSAELGVLVGTTVQAPSCRVIVYGVTKKEYAHYKEKMDGVLTGYLLGINTPDDLTGYDVVSETYDQEKASKFKILIRKDSIKKCNLAEVEDWCIDMEAPDIEEVLETEKFEEPLVLKDGSVPEVDGTVLLSAEHGNLISGKRYRVIELRETVCVLSVGTVRYVTPYSKVTLALPPVQQELNVLGK